MKHARLAVGLALGGVFSSMPARARSKPRASLVSLAVGVGIGVPLLVIGHHKVDVTARLSPTGGALHVTF